MDIIKKGMTQKDSTWIAFKPFKRIPDTNNGNVFFYKIMCSKIETILKWIENGATPVTTNPLFKIARE